MLDFLNKPIQLAAIAALLLATMLPGQVGLSEGGSGPSGAPYQAQIPLILKNSVAGAYSRSPDGYRLNVPFFHGAVPANEAAVVWFGKVTPTVNYSDLRIGYNEDELFIYAAVIDRHLWFPRKPAGADFTRWDGVSLYLSLDGGGEQTFRLDALLAPSEPGYDRQDYQAAYRLEQGSWQRIEAAFRSKTGWRGSSLNSNDGKEMGWMVYYHIPFSSLGLSRPPEQGETWRFGVEVHDRDDPDGAPVPVQSWPPGLAQRGAGEWAELRFGLPDSGTAGTPSGKTVIRQGFAGQRVNDKGVGGTTTCGKLSDENGAGHILDFWKEWGDYTYTDPRFGEYDMYLNVQNEAEISDFPCFSKIYLSFPLGAVPQGKRILSATLTLRQFGNSGGGEWGRAPSSMIQVFTLDSGWDPATLSWNNAPLPSENVSRAWVDWLSEYPGWPGVPRQWDLTAAVSQAYAAEGTLNLALYSADEALHSGKYFYSSDADSTARPQLEIIWGD